MYGKQNINIDVYLQYVHVKIVSRQAQDETLIFKQN